MIILGLTGSIGSGKSLAAKFFRSKQIPVYDADKEVHKILKNYKIIKKIKIFFPDCFEKNKLNKNKLADIVFKNKKKLKKLESIIHPKVGKVKKNFLAIHKKKKTSIVILEIPILFEIKGEKSCNFIILMTINKKEQLKRLLKRKSISKERYKQIITNQMNDKYKKTKADFIVSNNSSKKKTIKKLELILKKILTTDL